MARNWRAQNCPPQPKLLLSHPGSTYAEVMARYRSCPAVSQIWAFIVFPSTWMLLVANSTPMVLLLSKLNSLRVNRDRRLLFPTPESPISTTTRQKSYQNQTPEVNDTLKITYKKYFFERMKHEGKNGNTTILVMHLLSKCQYFWKTRAATFTSILSRC